MPLLRMALIHANHHHTHTCTSICPSGRLAQTLLLDWLSARCKVNAHTSKHCKHFSPKCDTSSVLFSVCLSHIHWSETWKNHLYYFSVRLSICQWELFMIPGATLRWWRVYPQSNSIISIITAIILCLPLMQANGWPIKIDEPGSVELIGRTWCLASVLTRVFADQLAQ